MTWDKSVSPQSPHEGGGLLLEFWLGFPESVKRSLERQVRGGGTREDDWESPSRPENSCWSWASQPLWKAPTSCALIRIVMGKG